MFACCNAAVIRVLLVAVGFLTGGIRTDAVTVVPSGRVAGIVAPAAPDTARVIRPPKPPEKPVSITITDEGINVDGEGTMKIKIDATKVDELTRKLEGEMREHMEALPESLAAILGGEDDAGRYARVRGSDVVQFGQDIAVEANELVNGNVVSIASDIRIDGKVTGDVAAIFGSVSLGPEAIVSGEVVSIFGSVEREDGSVIRGETAVIGGGCGGRGLVYPITAFGESVIGGVAKIVAFIIGILLMLILVFFMPGRMRRAADFTGGSFLKSAAMGLLLFFGGLVLVVILAIILAITIVGIPVAILLVLSFAALLGIGYSVSALALGSFVTRRFGVEGNSIYVQAIVGLFLLAILGIIASFMTTIPFLAPPRTVLRVAGGIANRSV